MSDNQPARPVEDRLTGRPPEILPDPPAAELSGVTEQAFSPHWDGHHIVVGPYDHMVINLGLDATPAQVTAVLARIEETWPEIAGRVLVIAAATVTVIEA